MGRCNLSHGKDSSLPSDLRPRLAPTPQAYLLPENFRERNLQLIQSIKDFLPSDEACFNKFKSHSGEFRQVRWEQEGGWPALAQGESDWLCFSGGRG